MTVVVTVVGAGKEYALRELLAGWDLLKRPTEEPMWFYVLVAGEISPEATELLQDWGRRITHTVIQSDPPIDFSGQIHPRNRCAGELRERLRWHLADPVFDWVFWVDSDVLCQPDTLIKLRSHKRPVVSGVVMDRLDVAAMAFTVADGLVPTRPGPQEVDWTGFGCILTEASLVRAIGWGPYLAGEGPQDLGEDGYWCVEARKITGQRVLLDGDVRPSHVHHTGLASRATFDADGNLKRELRFAGGARLLSNHSGISPRFGELRAGEWVTHDAQGNELTEEQIREIGAMRSEFLELVDRA